MNKFSLTDEQLEQLRKAHKAERNRRAAYRLNAVILLGMGWTFEQVKQALLLDEKTLRSYVWPMSPEASSSYSRLITWDVSAC